LDILSALDLAENDGRVSTLAEPNLTALSGETASFLAGGEFPIPTASGLSGTSVEFKEYGVSLAFTPTVLEGGRISMRVRPEVSELSSAGAIKLNGFEIPSLTTRRTETTVELGSGQSFMIGGLIRNSSQNNTDKAPFLGDLPILGALFRSTSFQAQRDRTGHHRHAVIWLKPVNAGDIALPTDGYRDTSDADRVLLGGSHKSRSGEQRPRPTIGSQQIVTPSVGPVGSAVIRVPSLPPLRLRSRPSGARRRLRSKARPPHPASASDRRPVSKGKPDHGKDENHRRRHRADDDARRFGRGKCG
jgi:pilus assembly protein CpaC